MRKMKDSGVEWVPEIPEDWHTVPIKHLFDEMDRPVQDGDEIVTCFRDGEVTLRKNRRVTGFTMADKEFGYQHISKGDLVVHGMDGFAGSIGIADSDGKATPVLIAMTPKRDDIPKFFMYQLRAYAQLEVFLATASGIRVRSCALNWKKLGNLPALVPSKLEQQRIVDYLDERCRKIDEAKAIVAEEVEALHRLRKATIYKAVTKGLDDSVPMRASGVDWIGEIPVDWQCCKQKYAMTLINGRAFANDEFEQDGTYRILRVGNLYTNPDWYTSSLELPADKYCDDGDLLYSWSMSYGPHIWHGERVIYHYHIWKVKLRSNVEKGFGYYYLSALTDALMSELHETTMSFVTMGVMNNSFIPLPPLSEQRRIADYLDNRCAAIDSIIETRTKQLERLEDYRKSLIFAYVTGKREVPSHE